MEVKFGNALGVADKHRGWFAGNFVGDDGDLQHSNEVEIKWGTHKAGDSRQEWSNNKATSMSILIHGRFRLNFINEEHILLNEGDYAIWAPGVSHTWQAEEDTLILTVRWPSL